MILPAELSRPGDLARPEVRVGVAGLVGGRRSRGSRGYRGDSAFTLIEMLVVVTIVGILAGVAAPRLLTASAEARQAKEKTVIHSVATAKVRYILENGPVGLDGVSAGIGGGSGSGSAGSGNGNGNGNGSGNGSGNGNGNGSGGGSGNGSGNGSGPGGVSESARWSAIRTYLSVRGVAPVTALELLSGTGKTNLVVGDSVTTPTIN